MGFSIDTRTLRPNDLFIAIKGPHFDGHDFLDDAFEKGACAALVAPSWPHHHPQVLVVKNPLTALEHIAHAVRQQAKHTTFIGITGSVGKTSTKEGLAWVLKDHGVFASRKSFNNHIGVPLTLANLPPHTPQAVFELGMSHAGEIRALGTLVKPHVGLITAIGPSHLEHFSSLEGIALAKAELLETLTPPGIAVLNRDDAFFPLLENICHQQGVGTLITFGEHPQADVHLREWHAQKHGTSFSCLCFGHPYQGQIPHTGKHWVMGALSILAVTHALGLDPNDVLTHLKTWPCYQGRGQTHTVTFHGKTITVIDDTYNANPLSMKAALEALALRPKTAGRRVVVLADMKELGDTAPLAHKNLSPLIQACDVDVVIAVGPLMVHLHRALPPTLETHHVSDWIQAWPLLTSLLTHGDMILLKGSRSMELDKVVDRLLSAAAGPT